MVITITYPNHGHGSDFLCFLLMNNLLMSLRTNFETLIYGLKKSVAAKIFLSYFEVFGNQMTPKPLTILGEIQLKIN